MRMVSPARVRVSSLTHQCRMAGGLIMSVAYAIDVQEKDDPYLTAQEHGAACVKKTLVPGAYLVDILPFCMFFPLLSSLP